VGEQQRGSPAAGAILTLAEVEHVAQLARLGLTQEQKEQLAAQLSRILEHFAVLQRLDTSHIPPTAQVIALQNVLRPDQVRPSLPRDLVLANAPQAEEGFFRVPAILEEQAEPAGP